MPQHVLLNKVEHRDLRIINTTGAKYGDDVMCALTFPAEFRSVQDVYPILFIQSSTGVLTPVALLGLREKQNLFLSESGWDAPYIPLMIERQPFLIGDSPNGRVIHVDMDSPRVSKTEGIRLFTDEGANTDYLERVSNVLGAINEGMAGIPAFVDALLEHELLAPFSIDIQYRDGGKFKFAGFHTIQEERLEKLDGAAIGKLHERGFLHPLFMIVASLSKFRNLVERASRLDPAVR